MSFGTFSVASSPRLDSELLGDSLLSPPPLRGWCVEVTKSDPSPGPWAEFWASQPPAQNTEMGARSSKTSPHSTGRLELIQSHGHCGALESGPEGTCGLGDFWPQGEPILRVASLFLRLIIFKNFSLLSTLPRKQWVCRGRWRCEGKVIYFSPRLLLCLVLRHPAQAFSVSGTARPR